MTNARPDEVAVEVENIVKRFGDFTAVDGVSFSVPEGQIFGFLGPNGAGKSTTIRMLCGVLLPTSGTGRVAGYDILDESEQIKKRIGYMTQKFSLYEDLTVEENIEFYAGVYGVPADEFKERRSWILEMANLTDRAASLTADLAVGWRQRLALGCAIVHSPEILFLDEPTAGVDPVSRRDFWDLIYDVSGEGVTVFVTTHYMDEAEHCDRLGLIYQGKLIATGSPHELKEEYVSGTLLEVDATPVMEAMNILDEEPAARDVAIFGTALHVLVADERETDKVRDALESRDISVENIEAVVPSLEDVFVALIEQADEQSEMVS